MRRQNSIGDKVFLFINGFLVAVIALIMFYPFWYEISVSLSDPKLAGTGGMFLWPHGFSLEAYKTVFKTSSMGYAFRNTLFVTLVGIALSMLATLTTAYPLSRPDLPARRFFHYMVLIPFIFSGGMIPTYLVVKECGLLDSLWALISPSLIASYNVIIVKNFMATIPDAIHEAAYIDGASDFRIFFGIVLPLSLPVLATIGLWLAVGYWNTYFNALIYITSRRKRVLQQVLYEIINSTKSDEMINLENQAGLSPQTVKAVATVVVAVPILMVYPFLQKYFVKGVMLGAVKG